MSENSKKSGKPIRPDAMDMAVIKTVPAVSLPGVVVFPYTLSPLVIDEQATVKMVESIATGNRLLALFPRLPRREDNGVPSGFEVRLEVDTVSIGKKRAAKTGTLCRIVKMLRFPDGSARALVRGLSRVEFLSPGERPGTAKIEELPEEDSDDIEIVAMARNAQNQFQEIVSFSPNFPEELKIAILNTGGLSRMVDLIADTINISHIEKLSILTLPSLQERLQLLTILLNREVEVLHLGSEIQSQVHDALSKSQREFFLREQLKTIQNELGENNANPDITAIEERMVEADLPEEVEKVVIKEMERLKIMHQASSEYHVVHTYIDWLLSVPWRKYSDDRLDVAAAAKVLDNDHYGLKDVKERILEFMAVLQLKEDRKAPILCFVGPPGVGKTSLGRSIAAAMKRKFVRMSLGGVRDEAEIRGHRRTYVGALPGRIIQGLKRAGTANPVFMLDEIDKLGNDFRGDPASALLEVLDPQQNYSFNDHYLEIDFDLSAVMFIATANILDTIPPALLDRMEIIRLPGYTAMEKRQIARRYLAPRQIRENGLKAKNFFMSLSTIDELISHYTREAGVRSLERRIGAICRKVAREIVEGGQDPTARVAPKPMDVAKYLGTRKFLDDETGETPESGVVTGLAWTSVGGTILKVEATMMPGKGVLKRTGSLGDVMRESAEAAFSLVKSRAVSLGIEPEIFGTHDFHIHVPDGATPKDGPSAGVTMTTALVSLLTNRRAKARVAMTGEITLRGRVMAVGGIKEKVIAALRAGVKTVVIPQDNLKDLEDIPREVRDKILFKSVSRVDEIFPLALEE